MNIKFANRLTELRKLNNLSQEQLADKLGVSRQTISKWERAEASPDTDNLIELAKLYNVTLDDLVNIDKQYEQKFKTKEDEEKENIHIGLSGIHVDSKDGNHVHIDKHGIHVHEKNGDKVDISSNKDGHIFSIKKSRLHIVYDWLNGFMFLAAIIIYVVLGCTLHLWAKTWMVFIFVPVIPSILLAIEKKKLTSFCMFMLVLGLYFALAMNLKNFWHPGWTMLFIIPVYYSITGFIEKQKRIKNV